MRFGGAGVAGIDYRRITQILAGPGRGAMDCRKLATAPGLQPVSAEVEGVRSKAMRLAARGWPAEQSPGMFSVARRRLMIMIIDQ